MAEHTIEQRFEVEAGSVFEVGNATGSISVHAEQTPAIAVRATLRGSEEEIGNTHVEIEQRGNGVVAQVRGHGRQCAVDFYVVVPPDCYVRASSASGSIQVEGVEAAVGANTASGALTVRDVMGDCDVRSTSGSVVAENIRGALFCANSSGAVRVHAQSVPSFDIATVSGDVLVESLPTWEGRYSVETVNGDVTLKVPAKAAVTFRLHSISGAIQCDLPVELERADFGTSVATLNGGGAQVDVNTTSGALRIAAESEQATSETGDDEHPFTVDTSAVLQALERGDLSVEDAMTRLERM